MSDTLAQHMAFMAHIPHSEIDYVIATLKVYDSVGEYLIGLETAEYEHMHFFVEISKRDYARFSKRVFIDRFKLRGRALKGKPRQYGKVKKIDNLTKMAAYTLKDGNLRTNMSEDVIKQYQEVSFQKKAEETFRNEMIAYVEKNTPWHMTDTYSAFNDERVYELCDIAVSVAEFMRNNGKVLRKSTIASNVYYVIQFSDLMGMRRDTNEIVSLMFGYDRMFRL